MESGIAHHRHGSASLMAEALTAVTLIAALPGSFASDKAILPGNSISQQELIAAIKDLERTLGFQQTDNFLSYSGKIAAYYRCYYTGKLELPESYEGLKLKEGTRDGCAVDPEKYDIFFYPIDAVANGRTPVTASLESSSTERLLVVVSHEDFHENKALRKLPATITEAASTLIGFLTASEVARQRFGVDSEIYRKVSRDAELFLQKAELVNRYHAKLSALYAAARSGEIPKPNAPALKEKLFAEIAQECKAINPNPGSFNKCLSANNNAGLAFDMTYTKYYPPIYDVFLAHGRDLKATIDTIKQVLSGRSSSEAVRRFEDLIRETSGH